MEGISLLAETYGHPMYLGMRGAKEIVKILNTKLELNLNVVKFDKEIEKVDKELSNLNSVPKLSKEVALKTLQKKGEKEVNYIG